MKKLISALFGAMVCITASAEVLPSWAVGTYKGEVKNWCYVYDDPNDIGPWYGTATLSVAAGGKVSGEINFGDLIGKPQGNYTVVEVGGNCVSISAEDIIASMQKGTIYFNAYLQNGTIVFKHNVPHVEKEPVTFVNEFKTKDIKGYIENYTSKFKGSAKAPDMDTMFLSYGTMESRYKGDVLDGKPHGNGIKLFVNGDYYDGEWRNGVFDGNGRLVCPATRMVYDGNFKNGVPHGNGNFYYACKIPMLTYDVGRDVLNYLDCLRYEGNFVDGKRHGKGKMYLLPHSYSKVDKDFVKDYDEHHQGEMLSVLSRFLMRTVGLTHINMNWHIISE